MALRPLQNGTQPYGQFDGLDAVVTAVRGGEVVQFTYVALHAAGGTDLDAADVELDGYSNATALTRPAVTTALVAGVRPLFLVDDGTQYYGTLFGQVVGATCGHTVTGGTVLGPHSATGSGKLTLWQDPGMFAVSLDAVDTRNAVGLTPNNVGLAGNSALYATANGLLTPDATVAYAALVVARFIEFSDNGALVTTPRRITQALNSPSGIAGVAVSWNWAHINFKVED